MKISILKYLVLLSVLLLFANCRSRKSTIRKNNSNTAYKQPATSVSKPIKVQKIAEADAVLADLIARNPNLNENTLAYIKEYNDIAILKMLEYKIPASITLAQGILESSSGLSRLAVKANNHFGIKCHKSWEGKGIRHDDDARQECFRHYNHPLESFNDHSLFLTERKRYAGLFDLKLTDYKGWAKGLKKAGYATDPRYPKKLITLIEAYELYKYDEFDETFLYSGTVVKKEVARNARYIVVRKGDTLYSLAKNNNLSVDKLKWLNGLKSNNIDVGQKLYIE
ncbi:MAG: N-acetylmuramidase [Flavobacteriales bacterium]|nr:MAG: N-acetylmuramidase [Flavobacteriales bacterium]